MSQFHDTPLRHGDSSEAAPVATALKELLAMLLYGASVFGLLVLAYGMTGAT